jgi:hypothetical protein
MEVTTDDEHDVKTVPNLLEKSERNTRAGKLMWNGAYG